MSSSALQFYVEDPVGRPFAPTRMWVVSNPTGRVGGESPWELSLTPPEDVPTDRFEEVDDLKQWLLFGDNKPQRVLYYDVPSGQAYSQVRREEVAAQYLRSVVDRCSASDGPCWFLVPALNEKEVRDRYQRAARVAAGQDRVRFLQEPEMVVEYFRLVRRELRLQEGQNHVLLVVDIGASTADLTIVQSRRDRLVVEGGETQREARLRAIRGRSNDIAGRWVDERLATKLGFPIEELERRQRQKVLKTIEEAKLTVSASGASRQLRSMLADKDVATLTRTLLEEMALDVAEALEPLFAQLRERLWDQLTGKDRAKELSRLVMEGRGVEGPDTVHRMVDTVLLAGGTSQLPGMQDALLAALFPGHEPEFLQVGDAYPVAAAVGAAAHVLHERYRPPRLRGSSALGEDAAVDSSTFIPSMESDVLFGWKQTGNSTKENKLVALQRDDPFADTGGTRPIATEQVFDPGVKLITRLMVDGPAAARKGPGSSRTTARVREAPGDFLLEWDAEDQVARVTSDQVDGVASLFLDLKKANVRSEAAAHRAPKAIPPGAIAVDAADDVIIDFGMSKTVALGVGAGTLSVVELERLCRHGRKPPPLGPSLVAAAALASASDGSNVVAESLEGAQDSLNDPAQGPAAPAQLPPKAPSLPPHSEQAAKAVWDVETFADTLAAFHVALLDHGTDVPLADLTALLLAAAVRPTVLLAGPPGCGKSTLVRVAVQALGVPEERFHQIPVQAHWQDDTPLFSKHGMLEGLFNNDAFHAVLLDEFNLTRPERYLARLFHALGPGGGTVGSRSLAPCRVFGTLNVDDASRPPSPKVIDRCFLLELQAPQDELVERWRGFPETVLPVLGCPSSPPRGKRPPPGYEQASAVMTALRNAVATHHLRQDLLPSRRAMQDVHDFLALHQHLGLGNVGGLSTTEAVDRALVGRVLVRLSGAIEQVRPALDALTAVVDEDALPLCYARLQMAEQQASLGFVSPWQ